MANGCVFKGVKVFQSSIESWGTRQYMSQYFICVAARSFSTGSYCSDNFGKVTRTIWNLNTDSQSGFDGVRTIGRVL